MEGLEDKEKKEEERRERIRKILPEVFMSHIKGHKPEEILSFKNGWWTRSVGPLELDPKFCLGLVRLAESTMLEIWHSEDRRMAKDEIHTFLPKISIEISEEKITLLFYAGDHGPISSDDSWLDLWVRLQSVVWEQFSKIMDE